MRIISWNMGYGFGFKATHNEAWRHLLDLDADIFLIQEARPPQWVRNEIPMHWRAEHDGGTWGTAVATRLPMTPADWTDNDTWLPHLCGQAVGAEVVLPGVDTALVVSIHAQAVPVTGELVEGHDLKGIKLDSAKDTWPLDLIFADLKRHTQSRRFIIGGDLNAGLLFDDKYGPRGNAEFFQRARDAGWVDCRERFHVEEQRTFFRDGKGPYQWTMCSPTN